MDAQKEEALKAKELAEKRFAEKDFAGAKSYAVQAKALYPELEGISQMVATFDVYTASEVKYNGELDYYSILGLKTFADITAVKKRYKKMAVMLHPDENKSVGADGAFKLAHEAWKLLSDSTAKNLYDLRRSGQAFGVVSNSSTSHSTHGSFWTVCTTCKIQYEYLRKYVNKRLSCKNCRGTFIAVETGAGPVTGAFPYQPVSYVTTNGHGSHGSGVLGPTTATYHHSGHGYEYMTNVSNQWNSYPATSGIMNPNGGSADYVYPTSNGVSTKVEYRATGKQSRKNAATSILTNSDTKRSDELVRSKAGRPEKKRKVVVDINIRNGYNDDNGSKYALDTKDIHGNHELKVSSPNDLPNRRWSVAPAFDARKLLIEKARTSILKKLEEIRLASNVASAAAVVTVKEDQKGFIEPPKLGEVSRNGDVFVSEQNKTVSTISISVPDSDFHDFDKDRSEECFEPKQIWAMYDEDDGMPRLYCIIRQVVSINPFKIHITYLNSKTDTEFGSVNWVDMGFTKSCGHLRAWHSDFIEQVNIFSHLLKGEKAGRGGCVRIFPKRGDIWALYRNWSPDWDRSTPDDIRHKYEMVEVLEDYSEEVGVFVNPLIKLAEFKTVYQRNPNKDATRWIPRREMLRFSHQVPSWLLKGEASNLPDYCWDLDPAAIPDELLQTGTGAAKAST